MPVAPAILQDYGGHFEPMPINAQLNAANLALRRDELEFEKKQRAQQLKEQQQAHANALNQYFGGVFNPNDFATKTDLDRLINDHLSGAKTDIAKTIQSNPNISSADLTLLAEDKLKPVYQLYQQGLSAKRQIDELTQNLAKEDPRFDAGLASQIAMHNMLYRKDPKTGGFVLDPSGIDPQKNYVQELIDKNPEIFTKGQKIDVLGLLKNIPTNEVSGVTQSDDGRTKDKLQYKGLKYAFQDFKMGKNGMPQGYEIHNEPVKFGNSFLSAVDDNTYNAFTQKKFDRLLLNDETAKFAKENKLPIEPGSDEFVALSKHLLYNKLDKLDLKKLSTSVIEDKRPIINNHTTVNSGNKGNEDMWIQPYIQDLKSSVDKKGYIPLDATTAKAFARDGVEPDKLELTKNGKLRPVFYKRNEDGSIKMKSFAGLTWPVPEVDDLRTQEYSDSQATLALGGRSGISAKQKNAEYSKSVNGNAKSATVKSSAKNYTINGRTFTEEQLIKGAKKNNLSLSEYKKLIGL